MGLTYKTPAGKLVRFTVVAVLIMVVVSACRSDDQSWNRIRNRGVLIVGLDPTFPPFEQMEGALPVGLDVDLIRALAGDLGLRTEFRFVSYDGLYDALDSGMVDVLISALVVLPEKTRDVAFSESYFNAGEILVVRKDEAAIHHMEDLKGHRLAVELGAHGHVTAIDWSRRLSDLEIQPFESAADALEAVFARQADAVLVDAVSGRLYMISRPGLRIAGEPVTSEPYVMAVRIEDGELLENLNERLAALRKSGRLQEIVGRWLPVPALD